MAPLQDVTSREDLGPELNAITALLLTLSAAFLTTRIWLKLSQHRSLWWDDYVLVVAWVSNQPPLLSLPLSVSLSLRRCWIRFLTSELASRYCS